MSKHRVSFVIPCFNEEGNITALVDAIRRELGNYELELFFVDDGSRDATLSVLKELCHRSPDVFYLSFSRNFGHQNALKAGLDFGFFRKVHV